MTYSAALDWLYTQLPMFQRQGATAFKKDLTNTQKLLTALGNPERKLKVIHIGGTNGKGSTAHLIAAALQADGSRVGLYTSPHYVDFRERIKINGQLMPETAVTHFLQDLGIPEPSSLLADIQPSFFELTVAMAFSYFAEQQVDWAVIEVGMGGRLDSTNVVDPLLSVITNISKDHTQFLGETLPEIAFEKAGIIKAGRPVIIGKTQAETADVFRKKAEEMAAPILFADQVWEALLRQEGLAHSDYDLLLGGRVVFQNLAIDIHGPFQAENIQTAVAALHTLHQLEVGYSLVEASLRKVWQELKTATYFIGRWQLLQKSPMVLLDSAHNEGGLRIVLAQLTTQLVYRKLHIVLGMVNDKDLCGILPLFPKEAIYYFAKADIPRGLAAADLAAQAAVYGLEGKVYSSIAAAYEVALDSAEAEDTIFVGGSIFTVAEVLPLEQPTKPAQR